MERTVKQRLIDYLRYKNISNRKFEMRCGLSVGYVRAIRKSIQPDKISSIALAYPELNTGWLLTGEGEMLKSDDRNSAIAVAPNELNSLTGAPVYDIDATCGKEMRTLEDETIIGHVDLPEIRKDAVIIKATGNSMTPAIVSGDRIAVREIKSWEYIAYGQIYLIVTPEYRLLKYIRKSEKPDFIILRSENTDYDDIEMPKRDIIKLFIVENILSIKNLI